MGSRQCQVAFLVYMLKTCKLPIIAAEYILYLVHVLNLSSNLQQNPTDVIV